MFSEGDYYIGSWDQDKQSGPGKQYSKGAIYEGYFDKGLRHGEGILSDALAGTIMRSVWRQGKIEGAKTEIVETGGNMKQENTADKVL